MNQPTVFPSSRFPLPAPRFFACACALALASTSLALDFHVAPGGSDSAAGSKAAPFASIERAQWAVREARTATPAEPVTVWLASGVYRPSKPLVFGSADSGTADAPVLWRSEQPGSVSISSGRKLAAEAFSPVTDAATLARLDPSARGKVLELPLAQNRITHAKALPARFEAVSDLVRLFFDGEAMPLSRWPNGPQGYTTIERVLDSGDFRPNQAHGGVFRYRGDRPERWTVALAGGGVWLRGFWRVPWVIEGLKVKAIDPKTKTISFATSTANGIGSKYTPLVNGTRAGDGKENWYALNLLEEIDQPGEWAVDFSTRKLYFWPPDSLTGHELIIADERAPVVSFKSASFIELRQLSFLHSLGDGLSIQGGNSITLAGCTVRDIDECGIRILGGSKHQVLSCDVFNIGQHGIDVTGGQRSTLTPSGHQLLNNHIHHIGLSGPYPAIRAGEQTMAEVVGVHIANNRIHDCPNAGVRFGGNDNLIEYNEVYRIGLDSSDLGAFYTNSGWTSRGNVLRFNLIHHTANGHAFYLDDGDSGETIHGNIIYKVQSGAFISGGHDHQIRHNLFIGTERAVHIDARGKARGYTTSDPRLSKDLASVPYKSSPWREKYPLLVTLPQRDTTLPSDVIIENNLVVDSLVEIRKSAKPEELKGVSFGLLAKGTIDLFRNPEALDFTLTNPARLQALIPGFPAIPLDRIGLQADALRPILPQRDLRQLQSESTAAKKFDSQTDMEASNRRPQ